MGPSCSQTLRSLKQVLRGMRGCVQHPRVTRVRMLTGRQAGYAESPPHQPGDPTGAGHCLVQLGCEWGKRGLLPGPRRTRAGGRAGGLPSPSAPPVPAPGTSRVPGGPCPPPLGVGGPLRFPACFLPSPPLLSHTRMGLGPGWHAGSHPGLADLHIKARGSPSTPRILETFRWAEQYSWRSLFGYNCLFLIA